MKKKQTFKKQLLAIMPAIAIWCFSISVLSCASDERGGLQSQTDAAPLQFALSFDDYEETRGLVSNDMDESVGLFAYLYAGDWELYPTPPNFMYDEEMQFTGSRWQTVGVFDQPAADMMLRFYAYYPFGLPESILEISPDTQIDAPDFTYTVSQNIEDQIDLMAGKSVNDVLTQNMRTDGAITIKMSHLLTAIEFQVGKCSEDGRIVKVELKNVLGKNNYSLSEHEEAEEDPNDPSNVIYTKVFDGWAYKTYENNKTDYKNFAANLNKKVTKTYVPNPTPQSVMNDDNAFLMLPQQLPDSAKLEVTINCGGSDHVLSTSLNGKRWLQGKRVTYTLDILSLTRLSIKSQITPWNDSHETIDGVASDGVTILMNTGITNWGDSTFTMNSDDPRTTP